MPNQPISGNDLARFAGPQTFMRLPEATSPEGLDVFSWVYRWILGQVGGPAPGLVQRKFVKKAL